MNKKINQILTEFQIKPSKKLGQNFLVNPKIINQIASFINNEAIANLVEIGPGLGSITQHINTKNKKFVAVEYDKNIYKYLTQSDNDWNVEFVHQDFLKFNATDFFNNEEVFLFGNIPYNISSPIILKFLLDPSYIKAVFMTQKEYYERVNAKVNTKNYSSLSVLIQTVCEIKKLIDVSKENFDPKPTIDSTVFKLIKKTNIDWKEINNFAEFVKNCFFMKRKTLVNNLKNVYEKDLIVNKLNEINFDLNIRPDAISVIDFWKLFKSFQS